MPRKGLHILKRYPLHKRRLDVAIRALEPLLRSPMFRGNQNLLWLNECRRLFVTATTDQAATGKRPCSDQRDNRGRSCNDRRRPIRRPASVMRRPATTVVDHATTGDDQCDDRHRSCDDRRRPWSTMQRPPTTNAATGINHATTGIDHATTGDDQCADHVTGRRRPMRRPRSLVRRPMRRPRSLVRRPMRRPRSTMQ
jgi:hypothetical protein